MVIFCQFSPVIYHLINLLVVIDLACALLCDIVAFISSLTSCPFQTVETEPEKSFGRTANNKNFVLKDINLQIYSQELIIIREPSGCGKSTLLNILTGLEKPTRGEVYFMGNNLNEVTDDYKCFIRSQKVGFIFQFFNLHPSLTAKENVLSAMVLNENSGEVNFLEKAKEVLFLVGLENRAHHYPYELSGGEKQRVGIARALVNDPPIIVADEPTGDLDEKTSEKIRELIFDLNKKHQKTVIIVSHDKKMECEGMRLIEMRDGKIIIDRVIP